MSTITLNYDPSTGNLEDAKGESLGVWFSLESVVPETELEPVTVRDLVLLREAGYTTTDIIDLSNNGLLGKVS